MHSPVLFMIFNRPELTRASFAAIRKARPPRLYVSADGPREDRAEDESLCREARAAATAADWPCEVKTLFRKHNRGCKLACASALTWFFRQEAEGVVIEDDCVPHQDFFPYCDNLLECYRDHPEIMLIGGSNYQYGALRGAGSYYFSLYPHIWGWASWARAWARYDMHMKGLEQFAKTRMSGLIGHLGGFRAMLRKFMLVEQGIDDTWDFQFVYSIWKTGGLSIIPNANLVSNIGNVADSAHPWRKDISHLREVRGMPEIAHPDAIRRDKEADDFHSGMLATEYDGREDFLQQEVKRRFAQGDGKAARELLTLCRTFYGADHPGFRALGDRSSPIPSGNEWP